MGLTKFTFQSKAAKQKNLLFSTSLNLPMLLYRIFQAPLGAKPVSTSYKKIQKSYKKPPKLAPRKLQVIMTPYFIKITYRWYLKHYLNWAHILYRCTNEKNRNIWTQMFYLYIYLNTSFQLNTCNTEYNCCWPLNRYLVFCLGVYTHRKISL